MRLPLPLPLLLQAREILLLSLPVLDDVMMRMLEALVQVWGCCQHLQQQDVVGYCMLMSEQA